MGLIRRYAPARGTLIDLGAAGGELGGAVRPHFRKTFGFEYQLDCIGALKKRFDNVLIADLETLRNLPAGADAIVCADVIEHLRDATSILRLIRESLAADGYAFVSVPNIANITVRLGLLFGVFEYRERGILDNTHLRFYTLRTIRRDLETAGFEIVTVRGSSIPIRLIIGRFTPEPLLRIGEKLLTAITRLWLALFAYQIVVVARPKPSR